MKQLSGNDISWYHPCAKEHAQEGKDSKEVSVLKGSTRDRVGIGRCNENITCCPYNRYKQGNKEGLKNLILKLNKEKIAICTEFSRPKLEAVNCQTLFICQGNHDNEDKGQDTG